MLKHQHVFAKNAEVFSFAYTSGHASNFDEHQTWETRCWCVSDPYQRAIMHKHRRVIPDIIITRCAYANHVCVVHVLQFWPLPKK